MDIIQIKSRQYVILYIGDEKSYENKQNHSINDRHQLQKKNLLKPRKNN